MKKRIKDINDVTRIVLIFLVVFGIVKFFGWMFKTIFN